MQPHDGRRSTYRIRSARRIEPAGRRRARQSSYCEGAEGVRATGSASSAGCELWIVSFRLDVGVFGTEKNSFLFKRSFLRHNCIIADNRSQHLAHDDFDPIRCNTIRPRIDRQFVEQRFINMLILERTNDAILNARAPSMTAMGSIRICSSLAHFHSLHLAQKIHRVLKCPVQ